MEQVEPPLAGSLLDTLLTTKSFKCPKCGELYTFAGWGEDAFGVHAELHCACTDKEKH